MFIPWDQWAEIKHDLCLEEFARWRYQLDVRQLRCWIEFVRMRHWGEVFCPPITFYCYWLMAVDSTDICQFRAHYNVVSFPIVLQNYAVFMLQLITLRPTV